MIGLQCPIESEVRGMGRLRNLANFGFGVLAFSHNVRGVVVWGEPLLDVSGRHIPRGPEATCLRFREVPCAVQEAIAVDVAGRGVLLKRVKRLTLVGPHFLAVVAGKDGHVRVRLGVVACHQRRPVLGAGAVAHRFAAGILVEGIKRHALGIDEGLTLFSICAEAADVARQKVRLKANATAAANVLEIAAVLLIDVGRGRNRVNETNAPKRELFHEGGLHRSGEYIQFAREGLRV
jgi:hypothetical protein